MVQLLIPQEIWPIWQILNFRRCVPSAAAVFACAYFGNDGYGNTTFDSCCSIPPYQSRAN